MLRRTTQLGVTRSRICKVGKRGMIPLTTHSEARPSARRKDTVVKNTDGHPRASISAWQGTDDLSTLLLRP